MPTLINKKYSYYDTPDGEDLDKKAWYVAQWAAIAGKFFTSLCESGEISHQGVLLDKTPY